MTAEQYASQTLGGMRNLCLPVRLEVIIHYSYKTLYELSQVEYHRLILTRLLYNCLLRRHHNVCTFLSIPRSSHPLAICSLAFPILMCFFQYLTSICHYDVNHIKYNTLLITQIVRWVWLSARKKHETSAGDEVNLWIELCCFCWWWRWRGKKMRLSLRLRPRCVYANSWRKSLEVLRNMYRINWPQSNRKEYIITHLLIKTLNWIS